MLAQQGQINVLKQRLEQLERLIFAAKSERFAPASAPEQMELFEGGAAAGAEEVEKQTVTYERRKKKKHPGRTPLPEHLPVRRVVIEPDEDTTGMKCIGEEITRKVEYIEAVLEIVETVRPKYARPQADQSDDKPAIVVAPVPEQVIPKGIAGASLLAKIVVAKYIDHLPFYRQIGMFKRDHGWAIHKSTINEVEVTPDVLLRINDHPINRIDELLPGKWEKARTGQEKELGLVGCLLIMR